MADFGNKIRRLYYKGLDIDIDDDPDQDVDDAPDTERVDPIINNEPQQEESLLYAIANYPVSEDYSVGELIMFVIIVGIVYKLIRTLYWRFKSYKTTQKAKKFYDLRNMRRYDIKADIKHLDQRAVLEMDVAQLKDGLLSGKFTSVDLVNFFAHRCYTIGRGLCLTTQENFQTALKLAEKADQQRQDALRAGPDAVAQLGLLHGVPFSVQDNINQKGKMSMMGMAYLCDEFMTEDALPLKQYQQAGAIPLVKSNTPQGNALNTENHVFGRALNPLDFQRSCGGISGGDSGLVASKCVPFSLTCDNNGSMKVAAAFCGTVCFKPSAGRFSSRGISFANKLRFNRFDEAQPCAGPMGSSVDDCVLGFRAMTDYTKVRMKSEDVFQAELPWNQEMFDQVQNPQMDSTPEPAPIKIGMLQESPFVPIGPSTKRAMYLMEMTLRKLGFEVVPFFLTDDVWQQGRDFMHAIQANGVTPKIIKDAQLNYEALSDTKSFAKVFGRGRSQTNSQSSVEVSPQQFAKTLKRKNQFCAEFSQKWQRQGLTALVSPIFPHCSSKLAQSATLQKIQEYSAIWNVLGFPCGLLPTTQVQTQEQYFSDHFHDSWSQALDKSAQGSEGMPINLQVIGYPFEDEKVLGIMKTLESGCGYKSKVPEYLVGMVQESRDVEEIVRKSVMNATNQGSIKSVQPHNSEDLRELQRHDSRESTRLQ